MRTMRTRPRKLPGPILFAVLACLVVGSFRPVEGASALDQGPRTLPPVSRGTPGDLWADVIIGKASFSDIGPYSTAGNKVFWAHGTIVDRTDPADNKLYIYDAGNNRILGFHLATCLSSATDPAN